MTTTLYNFPMLTNIVIKKMMIAALEMKTVRGQHRQHLLQDGFGWAEGERSGSSVTQHGNPRRILQVSVSLWPPMTPDSRERQFLSYLIVRNVTAGTTVKVKVATRQRMTFLTRLSLTDG